MKNIPDINNIFTEIFQKNVVNKLVSNIEKRKKVKKISNYDNLEAVKFYYTKA